MTTEIRRGQCAVVYVRGIGLVAVTETVEEVVRALGDQGGPGFLELHDALANGQSVWLRARDAVLVRSGETATVVPEKAKLS